VSAAAHEMDTAIGPNERIDRLEKKALLTALWLFVFLNHIFRAIHEIVKAEFLADAMNGIYNGMEVTEGMFLLGGIMIAIPIAMVPMMWVLPLRASRWANVGVASFHGLTVILAGAGDLDDYLHASLELIAVAFIIWQAWSWERSRS